MRIVPAQTEEPRRLRRCCRGNLLEGRDGNLRHVDIGKLIRGGTAVRTKITPTMGGFGVVKLVVGGNSVGIVVLTTTTTAVGRIARVRSPTQRHIIIIRTTGMIQFAQPDGVVAMIFEKLR